MLGSGSGSGLWLDVEVSALWLDVEVRLFKLVELVACLAEVFDCKVIPYTKLAVDRDGELICVQQLRRMAIGG